VPSRKTWAGSARCCECGAMVHNLQIRNTANWRSCGATTLVVVALVGFGGVRAETIARLDEVRANPSEDVLDKPAVSHVTTPARPRHERTMSGNPLWGIALSSLQETRARPIFSPSRRPPAPPVVAASSPRTPKPPPPREPDRLKLTLLGTVIGASDGIGVFVDETSKEVIRIRTGASHDGWILRSVQRRAANFNKNHQETTLTLAPPASEPSAPSIGVSASKTGGAGISGNDQGAANLPDNRAPLPILPVSAPTTRSAHKVRQDLLSIPASN
jgi:general secretion pathway protein N